jgi:hypothetical protein
MYFGIFALHQQQMQVIRAATHEVYENPVTDRSIVLLSRASI